MSGMKFYQSTDVYYTQVDLDNPDHLELVKLIIKDEVPSAAATKLMQKIGMQPCYEGKKKLWSSDLSLWHPIHGHSSYLIKQELKELVG